MGRESSGRRNGRDEDASAPSGLRFSRLPWIAVILVVVLMGLFTLRQVASPDIGFHLSAGNHILEAINHGICEVVERDSISVWNHLDSVSRDRTRLDVRTVDDETCIEIVNRLERGEFGVAVWDTTSDLNVPACT